MVVFIPFMLDRIFSTRVQLPGHRLGSLLWLSVSIPDVSHQGAQPIHQHLKAERYGKRTLGDIEIHGLSL